MKTHSVMARAIIMLVLCTIITTTQAEDRTISQRQFGKQTITVALGEEITFTDFKKGAGWNDSYLNNSQSLTVFRPATMGAVIQITFQRFDVQSDGEGWPGYAHIYNGDPDASNTFGWETDVYGVTERPTLPTGNILETLDGKYTDKTLTSTAADGILSVGMLWKRGKAAGGWVAKVRCINAEEMHTLSAATNYDNIDRHPRTKQQIVLAGFSILTEGESDADQLTAIDIAFPINDQVLDPTAIRLYTKATPAADGATLIPVSIHEQGDTWRLTLNHTLEKGNNPFVLVGDLRDDGIIGGQVSLDIARLVTRKQPEGIPSVNRATPVSVYCPGIVLMGQAKMVTVGDYPLDFFDDGGLDEDATPYYKGTITFLPQDAGKKVEIDFTKVRLFVASQYGNYGQYLKVYNGTDTLAADLLAEVKNYQTPLIKSSAPDGALTVSFLCTVSATDEGWEAKVSQQTPAAMQLKEMKVAQVVNETVSPGDTGQPILRVNIITEDNGNALMAQRFHFTTEGTTAPVTRATLFTTRHNDQWRDSTLLGSADIDGTSFDITLSTPQPLLEGDNYFWLAYDIAPTARNSERIDATLSKVQLSDNEYTPADGAPFGDRMVMHTVMSHRDQGTVVSIVDEELIYRNKPFLGSTDYYEWGKDTRTDIFLPKRADRVCQIDFSMFSMYWSADADKAKALFRIYEGKGTDGRLLWEYLPDADHENGPLTPITSQATDGALTIVFNADADRFAYTAKGWQAIVREYDVEAPVVTGYDSNVNQGSTAMLHADISGGTPPYTVVWKNSLRQEIGRQTIGQQSASVSHTVTAGPCEDYYITVVDSRGKTATDTCRLYTEGKAMAATFDNLWLAPDTYWQGTSKKGSFLSGTYLFDNGYVPEWNYWHGFGYSNRTATTFTQRSDQWNSAAGGGHNGSANYAVCYPQDAAIYVLHADEDTIQGCYVTNNAWVVDAILNGDGYTEGGFRKGDHLRLTAIGTALDGTERRLDFYLADYHGDNADDYYYLDTWQWFDLRPLGAISRLRFEMGSTRGNLYGITTPMYFCIDDFNGQRQFRDLHVNNFSSSINLSPYFTFDHPTATVTYTLADTAPEGITLSADGLLDAAGKTDFTVMVKAVQRGKQQYVRLIVGSPTGINTINANDNANEWYSLDGKRLNIPQRGINIVRRADGRVQKVIHCQ